MIAIFRVFKGQGVSLFCIPLEKEHRIHYGHYPKSCQILELDKERSSQIAEFFVTRSGAQMTPSLGGYKGVLDTLLVLSQTTPPPLEESIQILLKRWMWAALCLSWDLSPLLPQQIGPALDP